MTNETGSPHAPDSPEGVVAALERLLGPEYQLRVSAPIENGAFRIHCSHGGRGQDIDVKATLLTDGNLDDLSHVAERIRIAIGP